MRSRNSTLDINGRVQYLEVRSVLHLRYHWCNIDVFFGGTYGAGITMLDVVIPDEDRSTSTADRNKYQTTLYPMMKLRFFGGGTACCACSYGWVDTSYPFRSNYSRSEKCISCV